MCFSERYFTKKFPKGPPHLKKESTTWFQDALLFMTLNGKPIGDVDMKEFESITKCHVKPGDLRKINCTELKHDADQVCRVSYHFSAYTFFEIQHVRDSESIVAGHSERVYQSFYNIRAAQASHVLVTALQVMINSLMHGYVIHIEAS